MEMKTCYVTHPMTSLLAVLLIVLQTIECSETGCLALCSQSEPPPDSLSPECPLLPSDCVVTNAPCYCNCPVCRRKLGEPCSESKPLCEDNLVCLNADGNQKEDLYWWNIFNGGTCQVRKSDKSTLTDPRHIVTCIFIIVSIAVFLISLSYIAFLFLRRQRSSRLNVGGSNGTMTSYNNTAAELLLTFFGRFGKTTVRSELPVEQLQSEQSEMQLLQSESNLSELQIRNAEQEQEQESLRVPINAITAPPPYSDEHDPHCFTIFVGITLPEYTERQHISRPPSYNRIDEIL